MTKSLPKFWSFNRFRDASLIKTQALQWRGPFSWPRFEKTNGLVSLPDIAGVYLLTFPYLDGYILRSAGHTNSMKRRFSQHKRAYMTGKYTVLDVASACRGERRVIWHGWGYARKHHDEFLQHQDYILKAVEHELGMYHLFVADVEDERMRKRIEFSVIQKFYLSKAPWADLVDGGMAVSGRENDEIPVEIKNVCNYKIYGIPEQFEV